MATIQKQNKLSLTARILMAFFVILALVMFSFAGLIRQQKRVSYQNERMVFLVDSLNQKIESLSSRQLLVSLNPSYFDLDSANCQYWLKNSSLFFLKDGSMIRPDMESFVLEAGWNLRSAVGKYCSSSVDILHFLIIEGYDEAGSLGYKKAECLLRYWQNQGVIFDGINCICFLSGHTLSNELVGDRATQSGGGIRITVI